MRSPSGVVVIDKPRGPSSFDVVAAVRRTLRERRVGHTGTLDPMATGVLPVCVGEATKLVPFLMDGNKSYDAEAVLGEATDTLDATGTVVARTDARHVTRAAVEASLATLVGTIRQTPPAHSAIRVAGRRAYELARAGEEVELTPREVRVDAITLTSFASDGATARIGFSVDCGKGTYIRSLAGDLGAALGVGAHLTALRRTRVGPFTLADAVPLDALRPDTPLRSLADAVAHLPTLRLDPDECRAVREGKSRRVAALPAPSDAPRVRLLDGTGALVAVAGRAAPGAPLTLERVFVPIEDN
jgi:tRNA pseudouridine55 synthase